MRRERPRPAGPTCREQVALPRRGSTDDSIRAVPLPDQHTRREEPSPIVIVDPQEIQVMQGDDAVVLLGDLRGTNPSVVHGQSPLRPCDAYGPDRFGVTFRSP